MSKQLKLAVYNKHKGCCHYCNRMLALDKEDADLLNAKQGKAKRPIMTMDHYVPKSAGGRTTLHNLVPSCRYCNEAKGSAVFDTRQKASQFKASMKNRLKQDAAERTNPMQPEQPATTATTKANPAPVQAPVQKAIAQPATTATANPAPVQTPAQKAAIAETEAPLAGRPPADPKKAAANNATETSQDSKAARQAEAPTDGAGRVGWICGLCNISVSPYASYCICCLQKARKREREGTK